MFWCPERMHRSGTNRDRESSEQTADPGSPRRMSVKFVNVLILLFLHDNNEC